MYSQIGCNLNMSGHSMEETILFACNRLKCHCIQVFLTSPRFKSCKNKPDSNPVVITRMLKDNKVKLFVHGKYIYNFCRECIDKWSWQHDSLIKELHLASSYGAPLVIHQGKNLPELKLSRDDAVKVFADNITSVLKGYVSTYKIKNADVILLLENSANQGNELGYELQELHKIRQLIDSKYRHLVGFCLDTCHYFAAGQCSMSNKQTVNQMFDDIIGTIGIENLKLIHLNDSKQQLGSRRDNHQDLCDGYIWKDDNSGLKHLVRLSHKYRIPIVTETPGAGRVEEINMLKSMLVKR